MSVALLVCGLESGFGTNQVLHGVDLQLSEREVGLMLGLNGAGKSVTLKALSGLAPHWSGSVILNGRELSPLETEDRVRAGLAHVPQTRGVFPALTVEDNLRLGAATLRPRRRRAEMIARVYDLYPLLEQRRRQLAGSMSGGEQAMLSVARALVAEPKILLVDEPSAGLSPKMVQHLRETLARAAGTGVSLLLAEQNVGFGLSLADRVFVLEKGRVVYTDEAHCVDRDRITALLGIGELAR